MQGYGTCSAEGRTRIASAMAAIARLNWIWQCNTLSFASKFKLYKSLVICLLLYDCIVLRLPYVVDRALKSRN